MTNDLPRKRPTGAPNRQWRRPIPEDHINHYPPLIAGAIAAGVSVGIGLILTLGFIMAAWLFAAHGSESTLQVLRAAGIAWQVLHLVPIVIGTKIKWYSVVMANCQRARSSELISTPPQQVFVCCKDYFAIFNYYKNTKILGVALLNI